MLNKTSQTTIKMTETRLQGGIILLLFLGCSFASHELFPRQSTKKGLDFYVCLDTSLLNDTCKEYVFAQSMINLTWSQSRSYCQSLSAIVGFEMDLVAFETAHENDVVLSFAEQNFETNILFWTSAYDPTGTQAQYIWESTGYIVTYFNWGSEEPDPLSDHVYIGTYGKFWHNAEPTRPSISPLCERKGVF